MMDNVSLALTICAPLCVLLIVPFIIIKCAACRNSEDDRDEDADEAQADANSSQPELTAIVKKGSQISNGLSGSKRYSLGKKKKSTEKKKSKVDPEAINGNIGNPQESNSSVPAPSLVVEGNREPLISNCSLYEQIDEVRENAKKVALRNSTGSNGSTPRESKSVIVTSTRSPSSLKNASSLRPTHSFNSGHPYIPSQDRALPAIPPNSTASAYADVGSPTSPRILPDVPIELEQDVYDHLERNIAPQHMKPKSKESTKRPQAELPPEVKSPPVHPPNFNIVGDVYDQDSGGVIYASVGEAEPPLPSESVSAPAAGDSSATESTKKKSTNRSDGYTKVKKEGTTKAANKQPSAPSNETKQSDSISQYEAVYTDPPPVPVKLYNVETELTDQAGPSNQEQPTLQVPAGGSDSAQNSGSGTYYSSVNYAGLPPEIVVQPASSPVDDAYQSGGSESYDVLGAREPLATVRARALRHSGEEDYCYVDMSDSERHRRQQDQALRVSQLSTQPMDLYAEIDGNLNPPAVENDYDDYSTVVNQGASTSSKPTQHPPSNIEEEDYAVCDAPRVPQLPASFKVKQSADGENDSASGYATVTFNPQGKQVQTGAAGGDKQSVDNLLIKDEKWKVKRKDHQYQEIDEVRMDVKKKDSHDKKEDSDKKDDKPRSNATDF